MKAETTQQMKEFEQFLKRSMSGSVTLVDAFGSAQLAIQAAISEAFKTPQVIRLFAQREPESLRKLLASLQVRQ